MNLNDEIKEIDASPKKLKEFGLLVGGIFLAIGVLLWWRGKGHPWVFSGLGIILILPGLFFPGVLKYPYRGWMTLALVLGAFMSRVILGILYYFVITPLGIIVKLTGKDFLNLKFGEKTESYWVQRPKEADSPESCERQF